MVNWDENKFWLDLAQWLFMLVLALYGWLSNRHSINRKSIDEVKAELDAVRLDITQIKEQSRHQPNIDDIRAIEQQVSAIEQQMIANNHLLQTIHHHLLETNK